MNDPFNPWPRTKRDNMETCVIGIDPGASGGIAWMHKGYYHNVKMPDTEGDVLSQIRMIKQWASDANERLVCYVEDIPKFVSGSDAAMFSFSVMFLNYGFLLGVVQALEIPVIKVRPQTWQSELGLGKKDIIRAPKGASAEERKRVKLHNAQAKRDFKKKLKGEAQRRYPSLSITLDTCDAVLIMDYGCRKEQRPSPRPSPANTGTPSDPMLI